MSWGSVVVVVAVVLTPILAAVLVLMHRAAERSRFDAERELYGNAGERRARLRVRPRWRHVHDWRDDWAPSGWHE